MIARPMVFFAGMFIIGLLLSKVPIVWMIILVFFLLSFLYQTRNISIRQMSFTKEDRHRYLWPVFLIMGYLIMSTARQENSIETAFTQKTDVTATGVLTSITTKEENTILTLTSLHIQSNQSNHSYDCKNAIIYCNNDIVLQIGNTLNVYGTLLPLEEPTNPGQFDEKGFYRAQKIYCKIFAEQIVITDTASWPIRQFLYVLKNKCISTFTQLLPQKEASVLTAVLFGEKQMMSKELMELYQNNGMAHLMAVSGLHISLLGYGIYRLLRKATLSIPVSSVIAVGLLILYGAMTGFAVSTLRAICMFVFRILAACLGRTYDAISALAFAIIAILIFQPLMIGQASFLLSFGAIFAIIISNALALSKISLCQIIQLVVLPITCYFFFEFAPYAVLLNIIFIPLCTLFVYSGFFALLFSVVSTFLAQFLFGTTFFIANGYELLMKLCNRLPYHLVLTGKPSIVIVVIYYILLLIIITIVYKTKKKWLLYVSFLLPVLLFRVATNQISITCLDVKQGECIVIEQGNHCILIDGGSSDLQKVYEYRIQPYLQSQGIDSIDAVFLTHPDVDHISGIEELLNQMTRESEKRAWYNGTIFIKNLCLPKYYEENGFQNIIKIAGLKKVLISYLCENDTLTIENMKFKVLHPRFNTELNGNNLSLVLWLTYGKFDAMFTGDIEREAEEVIYQNYKEWFSNQSLDLLKLPHHGGKTSLHTEFLTLLSPKVTFISAGKNNRYGHPHQEIKDLLNELNYFYRVTGEDGALISYDEAN